VIKPRKPTPVNQASDYWLAREDCEKIISAATSLRDRCIIKLLYFAMMRRNEVRSISIEDIDFTNRLLNLRITKRGKPRTIPVIEPSLLDDLRLIAGNRKQGWLFVSKSKDGRLSNKAINDIVLKSAQLAGIQSPNPQRKGINPHLFRHSFARWLRRQNPPIAIEVLQKLLGHASVSTTLNVYGSADVPFMASELARCMKGE